MACASDPISLVGTGVSDADLRTSPAQANLLDAAQALEASYRENAWVGTTGAMEAARGWMNRLTWQTAAEPVSADQPGQAYAEYRQLRTLDAVEAAERLTADVALAATQARRMDQAARAIILLPAEFNRSALTRDLGEVETAIALTREAVVTFDAATRLVSERLSDAQLARVHAERDHLAYLSESLRDRADELARLRREMRDLQPFS